MIRIYRLAKYPGRTLKSLNIRRRPSGHIEITVGWFVVTTEPK